MGQGNLTTNLTNFELANPILVGEPNFNLANTNDHEHEQKWDLANFILNFTNNRIISWEIDNWPLFIGMSDQSPEITIQQKTFISTSIFY